MSTPEIDLDRHLAEEARGHAQEAAISAIESEFNDLDSEDLLCVLESFCPGQFDDLVRLAAEREYERRVEESLQAEADSKSLDD